MNRRIDLHGMRVDAALDAFIQYYNQCLREGYREGIEVVHGYGSSGKGGALLAALRELLARHTDRCTVVLGESVGNVGMTLVYPDKKLPARPRAG